MYKKSLNVVLKYLTRRKKPFRRRIIVVGRLAADPVGLVGKGTGLRTKGSRVRVPPRAWVDFNCRCPVVR